RLRSLPHRAGRADRAGAAPGRLLRARVSPAAAEDETLDELGLSDEDWVRIVAACRYLRIGEDVPGYLQQYLARWLEHDDRKALPARVRGLGAGQMAALWGRVRRVQESGG